MAVGNGRRRMFRTAFTALLMVIAVLVSGASLLLGYFGRERDTQTTVRLLPVAEWGWGVRYDASVPLQIPAEVANGTARWCRLTLAVKPTSPRAVPAAGFAPDALAPVAFNILAAPAPAAPPNAAIASFAATLANPVALNPGQWAQAQMTALQAHEQLVLRQMVFRRQRTRGQMTRKPSGLYVIHPRGGPVSRLLSGNPGGPQAWITLRYPAVSAFVPRFGKGVPGGSGRPWVMAGPASPTMLLPVVPGVAVQTPPASMPSPALTAGGTVVQRVWQPVASVPDGRVLPARVAAGTEVIGEGRRYGLLEVVRTPRVRVEPVR